MIALLEVEGFDMTLVADSEFARCLGQRREIEPCPPPTLVGVVAFEVVKSRDEVGDLFLDSVVV